MTQFNAIGRRAALGQIGAATLLPAFSRAQTQSSFDLSTYDPATEPLQLGALAAAKGLLFGSPFSPYVWDLPAATKTWSTNPYVRLFKRQCTLATVLYQWNGVEPAQGQGNLSYPDGITNYWLAQGLKIRVHALTWHRAVPAWFATLPSGTAAIDALNSHISTLVGHLKGKAWGYDVVNEAINPQDGLPYGMRNSPFTTLIGPDWMEYAFKAARAADPAALLTYNDYHTEGLGSYDLSDQRCAAVLAMIDRFQAKNVPIDAIGLQSHMDNKITWKAFNAQKYAAFLSEIQRRGLQIFLTEVDADDNGLPTDIGLRDAGVANIYKAYLETALANPAVKLVDFWGLVDRESVEDQNKQFSRPDSALGRPLLFDNSFKPKPAALAVASAFSDAPAR